MWEINEDYTNSSRDEISATGRSRVSGAQSVKVLEIPNTNFLHFLGVRCSRNEWCQLRGRKFFHVTKTNYALYKLGLTQIFLAMYDKWACIHEFNITPYKFWPSLILRFGNIVCVVGTGTTCTTNVLGRNYHLGHIYIILIIANKRTKQTH